ncbi:thioredoxin [Flavobacteriaceae bacterium S0825]|uniref:thioredoxin n=1 Tax=Gaetbulibacter sp. S0825 TaxID=2720084 RepID=UPI00142F8622|nr:thioredoxin [Gaetbulibacter sp. S0825]MCK0107890.1 thioredoxin [Flavobacteriaceae bacterium S0825]NIX63526.1 thioredoxin [Gaetbulibacter sp. S0825]
MKTIENKDDYSQLIALDKPILLDFFADWCGPCQTLLPTIDKLSKEYEGKVEVQKVNIDQNRELAAQFGVRSIPALFFLKNSKIVDRTNGLQLESVLREKLDALLD